MTKIEVTDEMLRRACAAVPDKLVNPSTVREILNAAFNPKYNTIFPWEAEITDEMVQRAYNAVPDRLLFPSTVKDMLEAALNPPEPEVVVTEEMMLAGETAKDDDEYWQRNVDVGRIYRAMRKLEP